MNHRAGAEPQYMEALRGLVVGDGLDLRFKRVEPLSGTLTLELTEGSNPCQACRMSAELLSDIALPLVRRVNPSIRKIAIIDKRGG